MPPTRKPVNRVRTKRPDRTPCDSTERPRKRSRTTRHKEAPFFVTNYEQKFWYYDICDKIAKVESCLPYEWKQRTYTATHPLIAKLRELIRRNRITCALCLVRAEGSEYADTHELSECCYQEKSSQDGVHDWLAVFEGYKAQGDGPGARCEYCKFPLVLCWRSFHREILDDRHGSEEQAREKTGTPYPSVPCKWVKPVQEFVASCMVNRGKMKNTGVSFLGATVLSHMGWEDWDSLGKKGPSVIRPWLEEMDYIGGFKCPRLLKLYGLLAMMEHPDGGSNFALGMEEEVPELLLDSNLG